MKTAIQLISEELEKEMYRSNIADDVFPRMAIAYLTNPNERKFYDNEKSLPKGWPIGYAPFRFDNNQSRINELITAGALIAAEINRINTINNDISSTPENCFMTISSSNKDCPKKIPFAMLNEEMAQKVHNQSLKRLNERGGMSPAEVVANIEGENCFSSTYELQDENYYITNIKKYLQLYENGK